MTANSNNSPKKFEHNLENLPSGPALLLGTDGIIQAVSGNWPTFLSGLKQGDRFADFCRDVPTQHRVFTARLAEGVEAILAGQESLLFSSYLTSTSDEERSTVMPDMAMRAYAGGVLILGLQPQPVHTETAPLSYFENTTPVAGRSDLSSEMTRRLLKAQEDERKRIARELHDDLGQKLAAHAMAVGNLRRNLPQDRITILNRLIALEDEAVELGGAVRLLSHELHTAQLEKIGLVEALRALATELCEWSGLHLELDVHEPLRPISDLAALALYRISQEALHNIERHARATTMKLCLFSTHDTACLSIEDNGVGFDPMTPKKGKGLGLTSISERVKILHGELSIHSSLNRGTRMVVRVPLTSIAP